MKFPYGMCDFYQVITEGYWYVDRTEHIRAVEQAGKQLLFLRPRRFGKSLWLSTLENYYDVAKADEFETLFGHLAIGQEPTPLHNRYFVLKWDFSAVDPQGEVEEIKKALHDHINRRIDFFASRYEQWLPHAIKVDEENALSSFESLLAVIQSTPYRLYLLIDEYDNFANEVLMGRGAAARYRTLLYGEGLLKTVFKAVKAAAAGLGLDRVFITGVSPLVLSDMTSGYNVAENISLWPELDALCGFTVGEVEGMLNRVAAECDLEPGAAEEALTMVRTFYDGYCFSPTPAEPVYNPTLVLYFAKHWQRLCTYPTEMLDANLAMDRNKIAYIARLPGGEQLVLDALQGEPPVQVLRLAQQFGVEEMLRRPWDRTSMVSWLYYHGLLTLNGKTPFGEVALCIPSLVIRKLYAEQVHEMLLGERGRVR